MAAWRTYQAGVRTVVLEARDRVGGRTCSQLVRLKDGTTVSCDVGGAYVGPSQDRILRVAKNFGVKTYPVYVSGTHNTLTGTDHGP